MDLAVLLAGLLAGASVLYDHLRGNRPTPEQLAQETTVAIDEDTLHRGISVIE